MNAFRARSKQKFDTTNSDLGLNRAWAPALEVPFASIESGAALLLTNGLLPLKTVEGHALSGSSITDFAVLANNGESEFGLTSTPPFVSRANFQLTNAAIFYGTIDVPGGVAPTTVLNWNVDTLILSNRRNYNELLPDTNWADGAFRTLKSGAHQDIFAYVNVGKVDKNVDSYATASSTDAWFGSATSVANINFANFWDASWLNKLKTEVDHAIRAGADGLFLDDVGVNFELARVPGRSVGENSRAMMQLVIDLATYARQTNKGGSEFRIMVNGAPFIINDSIFGAGGNATNATVGATYRSAIDAMLHENPFNGAVADVIAMTRMVFDFGRLGTQIVLVDSMKLAGLEDVPRGAEALLDVSANFGYIPLLVNAGPGGGGALDFLAPPRLTGLGSNRLSAESDYYIGTPLSERIDGGLGNDTIAGGFGNDTLVGGLGSDSLLGGQGDDTLEGGSDADSLHGGDGFDFASYQNAVTGLTVFMNGGNFSSGEARGDTHRFIEGIIGSNFSDILGGDAENNVLQGNAGSDWLFGVAGVDTLQGGDGNDVLSGGLGADQLDGGVGLDVAYFREAGAAVVASLAIGGTGGEASGDTYFGIENIWGSVHGDNLTGDNGAGQVYGFEGDDTLSGLAGDDFFYGGAGADTLTGGTGVDSFFFLAWRDQVNGSGSIERSEGGDSFTDFTSGTDRIILSRYWFGFGSIGGPAAALTEANANFVTDDSVATSRPTLIWNSLDRTLSFDADGLGATASVLLGTLQQGASLTLNDIWTA